MDKVKKTFTYFLIVCMVLGPLNLQVSNVALAEELPLDCGEGTVLNEAGTSCEDVPKEELPLECGEGTVLNEAGTHCEDVPKEDPPLVCGEGTVLNEAGTHCEDVPKEEPPLVCGEGTVLNEAGTSCIAQPPVENNPDLGESEVTPPVINDEPANDTTVDNPDSGVASLQLPEGLEISSQQAGEIVITIETDLTGAIPDELLYQLAALLNESESQGRQIIKFSLAGKSDGNIIVSSDAIIALANSNPNLIIDFSTEVGSSSYSIAAINQQQLAGARGIQLAMTTDPSQQFTVENASNPTRFEQHLIMEDGSRVLIDPIAMNLFTQNRLNIDGPLGGRTIARFDELLGTWVSIPTWNQQSDNELQFTGTYSGIYAAVPPQLLNIIDNPNRIPPSAISLINSRIIRGNPQGSLDSDGDFTFNQGLTVLIRSLGLEAGVPVNRSNVINLNTPVTVLPSMPVIVPNTSIAGGSLDLANRIGLLNGVGPLRPNQPIPLGDTIQLMNNGLQFSANQLGANIQANNIPSTNDPAVNPQTNESNAATSQNSSVNSRPLPLTNIQTMDIVSAFMAIQSQPASLLGDQLKSQLDEVTERNKKFGELNSTISDMRNILGSMGDNAPNQLSELQGDLKGKFDEVKKVLESYGVDSSKITTKNELELAIENAKRLIDQQSNSQQMDMLRLQSLSNKRNEAFDLMTNFMKKMQDNRSSIIGNMR